MADLERSRAMMGNDNAKKAGVSRAFKRLVKAAGKVVVASGKAGREYAKEGISASKMKIRTVRDSASSLIDKTSRKTSEVLNSTKKNVFSFANSVGKTAKAKTASFKSTNVSKQKASTKSSTKQSKPVSNFSLKPISNADKLPYWEKDPAMAAATRETARKNALQGHGAAVLYDAAVHNSPSMRAGALEGMEQLKKSKGK